MKQVNSFTFNLELNPNSLHNQESLIHFSHYLVLQCWLKSCCSHFLPYKDMRLIHYMLSALFILAFLDYLKVFPVLNCCSPLKDFSLLKLNSWYLHIHCMAAQSLSSKFRISSPNHQHCKP